jgi:hypothetical protein
VYLIPEQPHQGNKSPRLQRTSLAGRDAEPGSRAAARIGQDAMRPAEISEPILTLEYYVFGELSTNENRIIVLI